MMHSSVVSKKRSETSITNSSSNNEHVLSGELSLDGIEPALDSAEQPSSLPKVPKLILSNNEAAADVVEPKNPLSPRKGFVQRLLKTSGQQENAEIRNLQQAIDRMKRQREQVKARLELKLGELLREQAQLRHRLGKQKIAIASASQIRDRLIAEVDELQQYSVENEELTSRLAELIEETCLFADRACELTHSMNEPLVPKEIQLAALSRRRFDADLDAGIALKTKQNHLQTSGSPLRMSAELSISPSSATSSSSSSPSSPSSASPSLTSPTSVQYACNMSKPTPSSPIPQSTSPVVLSPLTSGVSEETSPTSSPPQTPPSSPPRLPTPTTSTAARTTDSTSSLTASPDEGEIEIDGLTFLIKHSDGQVQHLLKGGSVDALISHLFRPSTSLTFTATFLLTYHSFIKPDALLCKAIAAYRELDAEPEDSPTPSQVPDQSPDEAAKNRRMLVRKEKLRIASFLNSWVETSFFDFENEPLLEQLQEFLNNTVAPRAELLALKLKRAIERKLNESAQNFVLAAATGESKIVRASDAPVSILDFHPRDIAMQLTLLDFEVFSRIEPKELLGKSWAQAESKERLAPNIIALTNRFNKLCNWVATVIVSENNLRKRASILEHLIRIASKLDELNNFFGVMAVLAGLSQNSVYRLHKTWERLPRSRQVIVENLREMMNREANCKKYRLALHSRNPPLVPHLAIYLADLTFLEDGNPDLLSNEQINWVKRCRIAEVLREIHQYQQLPYPKEANVELQSFLTESQVLDPDRQFDQSLIAEPKVQRT